MIIALLSTSCLREVFCEEGEGDLLTETISINEFNGIDLKEDGDVFITQGDEFKVVVTARENILDRLETEVNGGIWDITLGRDCYQNLHLEVEITMPVLDEIHLSGSGKIDVGDFLNQDNIDMSISGSGRIELGSFSGTRDIDAKISGRGEILPRAEFPDLESMNINITGSGNFDGFKLITNTLDAKISGSGDIFVTTEEEMDVTITGSGNLHYKGNPLIDASITGSGKIINEN